MGFAFRYPFALLCAIEILACVGCSHPRNIDPNTTPAFGSSPALSSATGFAAGKWVRHVDTSQAKSGIVTNHNAAETQDLYFDPGGKLRENINGFLAAGSWAASSNGVDLQVDTIDGKPSNVIEQDKARFDATLVQQHEQKVALGRMLVRHPGLYTEHIQFEHRDWSDRFIALRTAQAVNHLELYSDNRQLYWPHSVDDHMAAQLGTVLFVRDIAKK
jgi:hypothetical protein